MAETEGQKKIGAVMVVGGGVAGVQSALDLADSGYKVYIVERGLSIGGVMAQLDKTFPTNDCSMCILAPKLVDTGRHQNIEIITNTEIQSVEGEAGNFKVSRERQEISVFNSSSIRASLTRLSVMVAVIVKRSVR